MKKTLLIVFLLLLTNQCVFSDTQTSINTQPTQNAIEYSWCMRNYQMPYAELFQRTLSAISASNYKIIEMQSKSSRVLFSVNGKEFWAGVTKQNSITSTLRILPVDSNYYFSKEIIDKIFNNIELNKSIIINRVNK